METTAEHWCDMGRMEKNMEANFENNPLPPVLNPAHTPQYQMLAIVVRCNILGIFKTSGVRGGLI